MKLFTLFFLIVFIMPFTVHSFDNNEKLAELFKRDQEMRTKKNSPKWPMYSPLEERAFRMEVFSMLTESKIKTADDFFRASIILIHTYNYGHENFILAAKLAEKSIQLGHKEGQHALSAAISQYSLHDQLPSDEWTLYAKDEKVITKQALQMDINNTSKKIPSRLH